MFLPFVFFFLLFFCCCCACAAAVDSNIFPQSHFGIYDFITWPSASSQRHPGWPGDPQSGSRACEWLRQRFIKLLTGGESALQSMSIQYTEWKNNYEYGIGGGEGGGGGGCSVKWMAGGWTEPMRRPIPFFFVRFPFKSNHSRLIYLPLPAQYARRLDALQKRNKKNRRNDHGKGAAHMRCRPGAPMRASSTITFFFIKIPFDCFCKWITKGRFQWTISGWSCLASFLRADNPNVQSLTLSLLTPVSFEHI